MKLLRKGCAVHDGRIRLLTSWDDDTGTFYVRAARMANGFRGVDWQQRCR